jgi:AcrR family transcriptional regulator
MARSGRPRSFDRADALRQAMEVFWALGYEGATLTGLQEAMGGIAAPSFYAAFGSKEELFREAVELYSKTLGIPMIKVLSEEPTARAAIEALLRAAVEAFCKPGKPRGCMLVLAAMNSMPANKSVQDHLRGLRARRQKLIQQRLQRGVAEGELPSGLDVSALASFYTTVLDGLAIQARDGASRKALTFAVGCAMAAWDTVVAEAAAGRLRTRSGIIRSVQEHLNLR